MKLRYYSTTVPNFGDDLNGDIWPALAPELFADESDGEAFIGIGTVIGRDFGPGAYHIFSSGIGNDQLSNWEGRDVRYHCVRGPISAKLLGLDPSLALTDGAVLAPLVPGFPDRARGGGGTVVIPHFQTLNFPGWDETMARTGFRLVDPRWTTHDVLDAIAGADLVLTESLHGAILADTYGVPWIAFATSRNIGITKWVDWTASVGLEFNMTLVPPPDPQPLIAFGRRREPFGTVLHFDEAAALVEHDRRLAPPRGEKSWLRERAKRSRLLRPFMGFSPRRTAAALTALAAGQAGTSLEAHRLTLRDRMYERLRGMAEQRADPRGAIAQR